MKAQAEIYLQNQADILPFKFVFFLNMIACNYDFCAGNLLNLNSNLEEVVPLYGTLGQVAGQSFGAIAGQVVSAIREYLIPITQRAAHLHTKK